MTSCPTHAPRVTVVLSVHNDADYIGQAVRSVLDQSFRALELLVFDDGSTDGTGDVLASFSDPRLVVVRDGINLGQAERGRQGFARARGEYVARMDADEVALPRRLERQVALLDACPGIGVIGSPGGRIDPLGRPLGRWPVPRGPAAVRFASILYSPFLHTSVLVRKSVLQAHGITYDSSLDASEDYDLFARLLEVTSGENLPRPEVLTRVRVGLTSRHRETQLLRADEIALRTIRAALPDAPVGPGEVSALRELLVAPLHPRVFSSGEAADIAEIHLDLLDRFVGRHGPFNAAQLRALRREEALLLARASIRVRPGREWARILVRAMRLDPALPARAATEAALQVGPRGISRVRTLLGG
ncbi:glycosyltransferase [Myxococcota bacterium]|nr:glycosyltransferase [Myxococcota bacterium]